MQEGAARTDGGAGEGERRGCSDSREGPGRAAERSHHDISAARPRGSGWGAGAGAVAVRGAERRRNGNVRLDRGGGA